jgi:hypothetical protein
MDQRAGRVLVLVYTILVVPSPAFVLGSLGVFTSQMSAIFVALIHIGAHFSGRYLILTNNMSSLKVLRTRRVTRGTHSVVYEIKEACWWLKNNGYEIHMM